MNMTNDELKKGLSDNRSGVYRPAREAVDHIEMLEIPNVRSMTDEEISALPILTLPNNSSQTARP